MPKSKAGSRPSNLFLIGFMGTGKSTIGKILAKKMGWKFVDSDLRIERHSKSRISNIIDEQGIRQFRKLESAMISDICKNKKQVVALGGGSIISPVNRRNVNSAGVVIHLDAKIHTLIARLSKDQDRPLIRAKSSQERLRKVSQLYRKRQNLYKIAATRKFLTDRLNAIQVATQIQKYMIGKNV